MTDQVNQPSKEMNLASAIGYARAAQAQHPSEITDCEEASIVLWREAERLKQQRSELIDATSGEIEQLRTALSQVTAAYDKLLKRMGAVREAVGTDPHFEAEATKILGSCDCPAGWGNACPLTTAECDARRSPVEVIAPAGRIKAGGG